jgi:hypothetical protein
VNAQLAPEIMPITSQCIAEFNATEAGLALLREQLAGATFDCSTTAGDKLARESRRGLVSLRTELEAMRKDLKAPLLARGKLLDDEAKRITGEIVKLETPIDAAIKAEEKRKEEARIERERVAAERQQAIDAQIERIRNMPLTYVAAHADILRQTIAEVESMDLRGVFDEVNTPRAEVAQKLALEGLNRALDARIAADAEWARQAAERAELERVRHEQEAARLLAETQAAAARAEADRIASEQRAAEAAAAKVEQDRIAAEQAEQQFRLDAERAELTRQQEETRKAAEKAARDKAEKEAKARAKKEADAIEKATLVDAAHDALLLLYTLKEGDHLTTRKLAAALAREGVEA